MLREILEGIYGWALGIILRDILKKQKDSLEKNRGSQTIYWIVGIEKKIIEKSWRWACYGRQFS